MLVSVTFYSSVRGHTAVSVPTLGLGNESLSFVHRGHLNTIVGYQALYQDLYTTLRQSCKSLTGKKSGITRSDCEQVKKAVEATEMNLQPTNAPEATVCAPSRKPKNKLFDDMENSESGKWLPEQTGNNPWTYAPDSVISVPSYATSGKNGLYAENIGSRADYSMVGQRGVKVPRGKNTHLHFKHSYEFDYDPVSSTYYDGGALEYSTDGGAT